LAERSRVRAEHAPVSWRSAVEKCVGLPAFTERRVTAFVLHPRQRYDWAFVLTLIVRWSDDAQANARLKSCTSPETTLTMEVELNVHGSIDVAEFTAL
jgi:hypothetical protein